MRRIIAFCFLLSICGCGDMSEWGSGGEDDEDKFASDMYDLKQYASDTTNLETHTGFSNNGISVNQLTESILNKYDQNHDKLLNVNEESFLRKRIGYEPGDTVVVIYTQSRGLLFTNADQEGNSNGQATAEELMKHLDQFDTDHNGELTTGDSLWDTLFGGDTEWDNFNGKYEERYGYKQEQIRK